MAIKGLRTQEDYIKRYNDRPENWREGIQMLEPNGDAPLFGLTSMLSSGSAMTDSVVHWFEEELPDYRYDVTVQAASNATTISVASGASDLKQGDLLSVESTGEHLLVTADPTSDTAVKVSRAFGGAGTDGETASTSAYGHVAAATIPSTTYLLLIGSIYAEGTRMPEARGFNSVIRETFCQIQKDTIAETGSMATTAMRTGDSWKEDKRRCAQRHSLNLEKAFFFSRKYKGTVDSKITYRMSGILESIPSDRSYTVPVAGMDLETFEQKTQDIFLWGANEKFAFCGHTVLTAIQQMVRRNASLEIMPMETEFGMQIRRLHTPHGTLVLKSHPLFNQLPNLNGLCVILDLKNLQYCYKSGRDTQWLENLEENDRDGRKAGFMTDCALKVMQRKTHYLIKDWTKGVKDA